MHLILILITNMLLSSYYGPCIWHFALLVRFNLDAAFVCYSYNWWLELSREDRNILHCKCSLCIFSMLEGLCLSSCLKGLFSYSSIFNKNLICFNCCQVVKPLLQERTRRRIQVLRGCGRDELLNVSMFSCLIIHNMQIQFSLCSHCLVS